MLDIGFWELIIIAVLALVVLGPERLPSAARTLGKWISDIKQTTHNLKSEFKHELRVSELHEQLKKAEQKGMASLTQAEQSAVDELQAAAADVNQVTSDVSLTEQEALQTRPSEQPMQQPSQDSSKQQLKQKNGKISNQTSDHL